MDEKKKSDEEVQDQPKRGSGSLLAAARKLQKKTVEEIADELNLSATQIRTIELDQSEGLPEPTYVRGYIRSYARLLGLDVDEVLNHYLNPNWQRGSRLDDIPRGIASANDGESGGFFSVGKVVVVMVLAAAIAYFWLTGRLDNLLGRELSTTTAPASSSVSPVVVPDISSQPIEPTVGLVQSTNPGSDLAEVNQSDDSATEFMFSLSFTDTSWVDIKDVEDNRLAFKNFVKGEDLNIAATTLIKVFIANVDGVSATLNGAPYDIAQHREGAFARFSLGE